MNEAILKPEIQAFIKNFDGELSKLAFAKNPFPELPPRELIEQIQSRRKIEKKLPTWFETKNIYYPPTVNLEQTSSETTARYKASLVSGEILADITGGFGVDSFLFSEKMKSVQHFENNENLSAIATHNFKVLNKKNIECFPEDGLKAVLKKKYDFIYADPSRRNETKGKIYFLKDSEPNIPENLPGLMESCKILMLKTSPMLDISQGLKELQHVFEIHIVAVKNEVKELLWLINKESAAVPQIKTINFKKGKPETFDFFWQQNGTATFGPPQKYLYEPNAAIMKSGAFSLIAERFGLQKLHRHTQLFTSEELISFPGRRFLIEKNVAYNKIEIPAALTFKKANIATRNFPETPEHLYKKWKLKPGGDNYLFFVTAADGSKRMLVCSKP